MPLDTATLLAFVPAALALNLTPGADMLFCLGQGLRGGPRAALAADLGIAVGCLCHAGLAGLGLAALMAAEPALFEAVRWAGVAWLLVLALRCLRAAPPATATAAIRPAHAFRDGLAVNLLNPKVALFVLAFLPQFADPARPMLPQMLALGAVLAAGSLLVNGAVGVSAGGIGRALARSPRLGLWSRRVSAAIFGGLALRLAWDAQR